jgi:catechol 2,3-dioxygenase-like lactoylglutathione lyase family enzyme
MVSDAGRSATWYEEKLGFRVIRDGHWTTAGPKDAPWRLHICEGRVEPGNTGIGFYSNNIEKEVILLKRRGVKFNRGITKTPWGLITMFEDPDGNKFWITQWKQD